MMTKSPKLKRSTQLVLVEVLLLAIAGLSFAQENPSKAPPTPGPMLSDGMIKLDTPDFNVMLVRSSQTIAALKPKTDPDFDFTPSDLLVARSQNGYFHLGDITLRLRSESSG